MTLTTPNNNATNVTNNGRCYKTTTTTIITITTKNNNKSCFVYCLPEFLKWVEPVGEMQRYLDVLVLMLPGNHIIIQ